MKSWLKSAAFGACLGLGVMSIGCTTEETPPAPSTPSATGGGAPAVTPPADAPTITPSEAPKVEAPKEEPKIETPPAEPPKVEAPTEEPKVEAPKEEPKS